MKEITYVTVLQITDIERRPDNQVNLLEKAYNRRETLDMLCGKYKTVLGCDDAVLLSHKMFIRDLDAAEEGTADETAARD